MENTRIECLKIAQKLAKNWSFDDDDEEQKWIIKTAIWLDEFSNKPKTDVVPIAQVSTDHLLQM